MSGTEGTKLDTAETDDEGNSSLVASAMERKFMAEASSLEVASRGKIHMATTRTAAGDTGQLRGDEA